MTRAQPTPGAVIRPATQADLPVIVAMRNRLNELELAGCPHASIIPMSLAQFTDAWARTLNDPGHCWRMVEVDGQLVGYALIYLVRMGTMPPGAYIHWAYLEGPNRRQGLGKQLLDHLIDWARAQKVTRVELQFVDGNTPAEKFWTRHGFTPYARKCVLYLE